MTLKLKLPILLISLGISLAGFMAVPAIANAEAVKKPVDCASGKVDPKNNTKCVPIGNACAGNTAETCLKKNPIIKDLKLIINFLSAGVAIVVIGVIILGGIQYAMAGDNATAVSAAKQRITNGLIAFAAFLLTFAFLQWLVPGGIFNS